MNKDKIITMHNINKEIHEIQNLTSLNSSSDSVILNKAKDIPYITVVMGFFIAYLVILIFFPACFHLINNFLCLSQNLLKILLFNTIINSNAEDLRIKLSSSTNEETTSKSLPIYSILVPLYQEIEKLESIIEQLSNLHYPQDRLDAKIVIEEDDKDILNALNCLENDNKIPSFIEIIKVPNSLPKTKPKALNYAMNNCRGKYLVIFDAEDKPDPNQLLRAVEIFAKLPKNYACLQAKLNFYNSDENLLTKFFSLEYKLWFDYLLKALCILNLPIPLGGTSNHFRTKILCKIGLWDAYNVSEDAELGIRLYFKGYRTYVFDSYTLEEAPVNINIWLKQRARWIKGYIQTTLTVIFFYKKSIIKIPFLASITIYIFMAVSSYTMFIFPWLVISIPLNKFKLINHFWLINSIFALSYCYISSYYVLICNIKGQKKYFFNAELFDYITILCFPLYFILHVIASYMAIWEIIFRPFKWNKTKHGVSKIE